ncbi:MAG: hypothetical protein [Betabaculovirus sp.]|nr:MAG: hypothetical protein [Betabaculovirus sp.]
MSKIISKKCVAAHPMKQYQIKNINVDCLQKLYFDWLPQEVYDMIVEHLYRNNALNLQCAYFRSSNKNPIMYNFEGTHLNMFKSVQQIPIKYTQLPRVCNCQEEMEYGDIFICTTCKLHKLSYYTVCVDLLGVKKFQIS